MSHAPLMERLTDLTESGVIAAWARDAYSTGRWSLQIGSKTHYYTTGEVRAFLTGYDAAKH